jgi:hypothetical protein
MTSRVHNGCRSQSARAMTMPEHRRRELKLDPTGGYRGPEERHQREKAGQDKLGSMMLSAHRSITTPRTNPRAMPSETVGLRNMKQQRTYPSQRGNWFWYSPAMLWLAL